MSSGIRFFVAFMIAIFNFSISAEDFQKPSNLEIEKLLATNLQGGSIPTIWIDSGYASDTKINKVQVVEWGIFNNREQYWPAKIRVAGSTEVTAVLTLYETQAKQFDVLAEFRFYKDDYGKLKAYTSDFGGWTIIPDRNALNYHNPKPEITKQKSECPGITDEECTIWKMTEECAKITSTGTLGPCMNQHGYNWDGFRWIKQK